MTKAEKAYKAKLAELSCFICEKIFDQHPVDFMQRRGFLL